MVRRLRYGDGEPLLLETFWVPRAVCPELSRHELSGGARCTRVMRSRHGVDPVSAETSLEPAALDAADARHLVPARRAGDPASPARPARATAVRSSSPATSTAATAPASTSPCAPE